MLTQKEQRATGAKLMKSSGDPQERKAQPTLLMEYRGHDSDRFRRSIRKITQACVLFTTRKMKNCLTFPEEQNTR